MLPKGSFLADMVMPSASEAISRTMSCHGGALVARLAGLMNQAFSAKRHASRKSGTCRSGRRPPAPIAEVLHAHGLATAGVVGDGHEHDGHSAALSSARSDPALRVHVAFERVAKAGLKSFGDGRSTASAPVASTLARVVSKWVLFGIDLARAAEDREEDRARLPGLGESAGRGRTGTGRGPRRGKR